MVSVPTSQFCHYSLEADVDNMGMHKYYYIPIKFYYKTGGEARYDGTFLVISALGRLVKEDLEFDISLGYMVSPDSKIMNK
jgi:hypothetical protein